MTKKTVMQIAKSTIMKYAEPKHIGYLHTKVSGCRTETLAGHGRIGRSRTSGYKGNSSRKGDNIFGCFLEYFWLTGGAESSRFRQVDRRVQPQEGALD